MGGEIPEGCSAQRVPDLRCAHAHCCNSRVLVKQEPRLGDPELVLGVYSQVQQRIDPRHRL